MYSNFSTMLGSGLIFGAIFTAVLYIYFMILKKEKPKVKFSSLMFIALLIFLFSPIGNPQLRFLIQGFTLSFILSLALRNINDYKIIGYIDKKNIEIIAIGSYAIFLILAFIFILLNAHKLTILLNRTLEAIIIFSLGFIISIKMLWGKNLTTHTTILSNNEYMGK